MATVNLHVWLWFSVATVFGGQNSVLGFLTGNRRMCNSELNSKGNGNCENKKPNFFEKTPELVMRYGYPVETHTVTTEDGYLLTVHRIPGSPKASASSGIKTPVLVQHGILVASDFWLLTGPEHALGFLLADRGYDVWLGNARGNFYSRKHVTLSPKDPKFWDFTWHEMGVYDLPAVIDHILKTTNQKQLLYIGHSMGTTMFFVLTSSKPEYNAKIRLMVAFAPVVFSHGLLSRNLNAKLSIPFAEILYMGFQKARIWEILPRIKVVGELLNEACSDGRKTQPLCQILYYAAYGYDGALLNKTMLPVFAHHLLSGMSVDTLYHFTQITQIGRFQMFDRSGKIGKIMPEYNLTQVTVPVSIHFAPNDIWSPREGVIPLSKRLRNVVKIVRIPDDRVSHNGFGFTINSKELIYNEVFNLLANN